MKKTLKDSRKYFLIRPYDSEVIMFDSLEELKADVFEWIEDCELKDCLVYITTDKNKFTIDLELKEVE